MGGLSAATAAAAIRRALTPSPLLHPLNAVVNFTLAHDNTTFMLLRQSSHVNMSQRRSE
jgi:hypothetical protein